MTICDSACSRFSLPFLARIAICDQLGFITFIIRVPGHKPNKAEVNLRAQNFSRFFSAAPLLEGSVCESRAREEAELFSPLYSGGIN